MATNTYAVLGLGRFGHMLAVLLAEGGAEVIAVDVDRSLVEAIADKVTIAVCLDATDERALKAQGIDQVDVAIVAIGEFFEANVLATLLLKSFDIPRVITRSMTWVQTKILNAIGADEVIAPEEESAKRLAKRLGDPRLIDHFQLTKDMSMIEIKTPKRFVGQTLRDLNLRSRYKVNLVAVSDQGDENVRIPNPDEPLQENEDLFIIGKDEDLEVLTTE